MSEFVLLPWDYVIVKKTDIGTAEVFQTEEGQWGIKLIIFRDYEQRTLIHIFNKKKQAVAALRDLHERLEL